MKIGLYSFWNFGWDGATVTGLGCHIRYLRHFLSYTDGIRLFTPIIKNSPLNTERLSHPQLEVVPVPWGTWSAAWLNLRDLRRLLAANLDGLDAMYVRLFEPCAWVLGQLCAQRNLGAVFHIVGNPVEGIFQREDWNWAGKWLRRLMFYPEELLVKYYSRPHRILINGSKNARWFARRGIKGEMVISSTLEENDFSYRDDTCQRAKPLVLYAGFIRPTKRLEVLLEAVARLAGERRRLAVRLVGPVEPPGYLNLLQQRLKRLGIEDRVEFAGFVPHGEKLNHEYRGADIFAFPSSASEGSPRVLLEAAANALPIVTTDVGSVQDLFTHGESAMIVPVNHPEAMAAALARYLEEPALRRQCLRKAQEVAKNHTIAAFIKRVMQRLEEA